MSAHAAMREYDIYIPVARNDGSPIDPEHVRRIKDLLTDAFGGFTHLNQSSEGVWKVGGFTFRDEVTIMRVLDDGRSDLDMTLLKKRLEGELEQKSVLIVQRMVEVVR